MERFRKSLSESLITRFISYCLMLQLIFPPLWVSNVYAALVTDPHANVSFQPQINNPSGVPIINIVAPNSSGLSHNKYQDFDIAEDGAVFNNSLVSGNSRLAGQIVANPLFGGRTASIILNEVTGASDSELKGLMEIFGDKANIIIANPNGITCNGCGFINTQRATLTTGTPEFSAGKLKFDIDGGLIRFEEEGHSYRSFINEMDVLSQYIDINGDISTKNRLSLAAGRFVFDYSKSIAGGTLTEWVEPKTRDAAKTTDRALAIDGTIFGAMQSGQIDIMGTERGLGVKADGYLFAQADDLFIQSAGGLSINNADAVREINITAEGDLTVGADLIANQKISLHGKNVSTNQETNLIASALEIVATEKAEIHGELKALDIRIEAGKTENTADILAVNNLDVVVAGINQHSDARIAADIGTINSNENKFTDVTLSFNELAITSLISDFKRVNAQLKSTELNLGKFTSLDFILNADTVNLAFSNWEDSKSQFNINQYIAAGQEAIVKESSWVFSNGNFDISDVTLNDSRVYSLESTFDADEINITRSDILSNDVNINTDDLNISSSQLQAQTASLNADNAEIENSTIAAVNLAITSDAIFDMDVNSIAVATESVTVDANDLRLKGSIKANRLGINAEKANFEGTWQVSEAVNVDVTTAANINNLSVGSNIFTVNAASGQWDNLLVQAETATLTTTDKLELKNSTIEAATSNITAKKFSTDENTWIGANTNKITVDDFTNGGKIVSAEHLNLNVANKVINSGSLASFSTANLSASELENSGVITSNELALESAKINNAGTVSATNLDITYQELRNHADAKLLASEATYTALGNAALFENYGEQVAVNAVQWLKSGSADNSGQYVNTGKLQGNALNFAGLESVSNGLTGVILSNGSVDIGNEEFIQKGSIDSANLNITRTTQGVVGAFSNQGEMFADQLTINSKAELTNSGKIVTEIATVDLTKADDATGYNRFTNENGGVLSAKDLTISGADITNSGQWVATTLDVTGVRSASGTNGTSLVNTETGIMVQRHAINDEDVITEYGSASFSGFDRFTNKGAIEADELLSIKNVKHFDNNEAKLAEHQTNNTLNLAAKISSAGGIVISQTDSITNSGLLIGSAISADSKKVSNTGIIGAGEASIQSSESAFTNNGKVYQSDLALADAQRARLAVSMTGGTSTVKGAFNISAGSIVNNERGAIEIKNGDITVAEGSVENRGLIRELNDNDDATQLNLLGISSLENYGSVSITSALVLKDAGALRNHGDESYLQAKSIKGDSNTAILSEIRNDGTILVRDDISLNSANFSNNSAARIFAGNIDLNSQNGMTNNGLMQSEGNLSLAANSLQNTGEIIGKGTTSLAVNTLGNSHLIYGDTLNVGSAAQRINEIASSSPMRVQAQAANQPTGLVAAENLNLYMNGVMRDVYQATNILIDGTDVTIAGTVIGDNKVDVNARNLTVQSGGEVNIGNGVDSSSWNVTAGFVNNGNIDFNSDLKITSASFTNNKNIRGDADLNINTRSFKNDSSAVISIKDSTPTNADINDIQISGIADGFSTTDKASTFLNSGEIHSDGALDIAAGSINVNGNIKALDDSEWHFDSFNNNNRITIDGTWSLGNSSARSGNVVNNGRLYGERIEAYTSGTFSNNANAKIVAYGSDVILNVNGSLNNSSAAVIYGKNRFDLNASNTINNVGVIESFTAGHTSNISSSVFNNGDNIGKAGVIRTAGSLNLSVSDFTNHSYEGANKGDSQRVEKAIDYRYDPSTGGSKYYWRHYVTFVDGEVNNNVYRSGIYVNQDLTVNNSNIINNGGEMSVVGNFNLTKSTFKNKNSKVSNVNTNVLSWYRRTSNNKSATNSYGNSFESRFAVGGEQKEAAARELEETIYYDNGLYYWKGPWHVNETGAVASQGARGGDPSNGIRNLAAVSVDNPYGLGLVYVGGTLSADHSDIENSAALNAGHIDTDDSRDTDDTTLAKNIDDKDAANAVNTADKNDQAKGSFSNEAGVNVLDLVADEPTPTISLLAFVIPGLSFEALNAASVAGEKTAEELAAQAALQAQLNLLNGDKDQNSKNLQSQSDGHGTQAPSLFDLDADILARIIADTEYELSPEYIFDKVDPDKTLNTEPKFFLDPYQEAQAVTQAALQQTGTAFFSPDWTTSADQRKGLYDNTLEYLVKQQGVTLGKALTPMQVKQLEQPMIWYVSMNIGGQSQLVPTVYLPEATLEQITTPSAGTIIADSMDLDVSEFKNTGDIKVANSARIRADVITNQRNVMKFGDETNYTAIAGAGGNISAGDLALISRSDINNNGGSLSATNGLTLDAQGDINLNALELKRRSQSGQNITESTDYLLSQINAGGDATFKAGGDINSQAAQAKIGGNGIFDATNINLLGVTERDYSKTVSKKKSLTSSSKTTIEQEKLDFIGSDFQIGGNMVMNAENDITMVGANIDVGKSAAIKAGNDITLTAGISTDKYSKQKSGSGVATTSSQQKGHVKETATGTLIKTGESLQIDSDGGNVTILASELDAKKNLVLGDMKVKVDENGEKVVDENGQYIAEDGSSINNLTIGTVELKDESWNVKSSGLKGPLKDLAAVAAFTLSASGMGQMAMAAGVDTEMEVGKSSESRVESTTHATSKITAGETLAIKTDGDFRLEGSQVNAKNASIETQSTTITAVENTTTTTESESTHTVGATKAALKKDEVTVAGATETKHKETTTTTDTELVKAGLNVSENLTMTSVENIDILASDVNVEGNAKVKAKAITVAGLKEKTTTEHKEKTETSTTSVGVKNAYVDTALALQAIVDATSAVDKAKSALSKAKRDVKSGKLQANAVDDYKANLAAATAQLGQVTIAAAASAAAAAATTGTAGFYVSGKAEKTTTEKTSTDTEERYIGSTFNVGGDASFDATDSIDIIGSGLDIGGGLALNAKDVTIKAGTEETTSTSKETTRTAGASYSSNGGGSANASGSNTDADSYSKTHINSTINAGSLTSTSENLTLSGANVEVAGGIDIDTGNLVIESLQDESSSNSKTEGYSVGVSTSGSVTLGANENDSKANSQWVNNQTTLIGGTSGSGDVNISADKTTLKGAVVASATRNEDGSLTDNGTLNLATDELIIEDIKDKDHSENKGFDVSTSFGSSGDDPKTEKNEGYASGSTTVGLTSDGHKKEQNTLATLGGGNITKRDGSAHEEGLVESANSDLNNSQEITKDVKTGGLNASVTVDHRLASEKGRESIKTDLVIAKHHAKEIGTAVTEAVEGDENVFSRIRQHAKNREGVVEIHSDDETQEALNDGTTDAEGNEVAMQTVADKLAKNSKVEGADVNLYDGAQTNDDSLMLDSSSVNKGEVEGAYDKGNKDIYVNVDKTDMTDGAAKVGTVAHEAARNRMGQEAGRTRENETRLATNEGNLAKDLWNDLNGVKGIKTGKAAGNNQKEWLANNRNSATVKKGTNKIAKVDSKDLRARQANRNEASMLDKARSKINNDTTKTSAEKAQELVNLDALACAEIQCAAGVSANDPQYDAVMKLQNDGEKLQAEQGLNIIDTLSDLGVGTTVEVEETKVTNNFLGTTETETTSEQQFGYDGVDTVNDAITSNEQTVARAQQAGEVVAGTLEVAGAGALCTTGIGCAAGVAVGALGTTTLASGVVGLTSEYEYVNGQKVVDSLSAETHQGDNNPLADVALDATLTVASGAAGKTIERNADQIGDSLGALKDKVVGGKPKVDSNPVDNSVADGEFSTPDRTIISAKKADSKVEWVDENASMSDRARDYDDSATGSRSNIETQKGQAPSLDRTLQNGNKKAVKFDGLAGEVLIDRKISVVTTAKAKNQVLRQSQALKENGLAGRWEVTTAAQARRAQKMFDELDVKNIEVKVVPEP